MTNSTGSTTPFRLSSRLGMVSLVVLAQVLGSLSPLTGGTPLTRSVSLATLPLVIPLAVWSQSRRPGRWTWLVAGGGLAAGPARALLYDPLRDRGCIGCLRGGLVIHPDIAAAQWLALVGGILILGGAVIAASRDRRAIPALLAVAAVLAVTGFRTPLGVLPEAVLAATWVAVVGTGFEVARSLWSRRQLRLLAIGLLSGPTQAARRALGRPNMLVLFAVGETWVDAAGDRVEVPPAAHKTPVEAGGEVLALLVDDTPFVGPLPPGLILGLTSARLGAQLAVQERELTEARRRLVQHADDAALRLERDLHDGAQQHLLALAMELRLALDTAPPIDRDRLEKALASVSSSLDDLREISHGIYPPLLAAAGLVPALSALARYTDVSLTVTGFPSDRLSEMAERTAYLVVLDAALRATSAVVVSAHSDSRTLVLELNGSPPPAETLIYDRVAAAGGAVVHQDERVVVKIPCE